MVNSTGQEDSRLRSWIKHAINQTFSAVHDCSSQSSTWQEHRAHAELNNVRLREEAAANEQQVITSYNILQHNAMISVTISVPNSVPISVTHHTGWPPAATPLPDRVLIGCFFCWLCLWGEDLFGCKKVAEFRFTLIPLHARCATTNPLVNHRLSSLSLVPG